MKLNKLNSALLFTALFFSCNTTKITSSWKADNSVTKTYHNIMVWGILTDKDSTLRKNMENHLVNDLTAKGYHAISAMDVYREKAFKKLTEKEIVDEFKHSGVDAVITLVLLSKEKEAIYYPGSASSNPSLTYDQFDKYYTTVFEKIFTPGYYITTTNYFWESNLFEVSADKLVYSARTKSFDPSNAETLGHENGVMILNDMIRKKVIRNQLKEE